ncbi:membrane protein DedA, SNARE-associated domain [Gracilibacillus orientalis]|uniref:Membrane protein DedA, SNARE-associated domain n=1 Tax=Gracilibacillus orientalis TaxID=334253 RepID=A0A1I4HGC1_9BACI|nr:DedA family protein [Gracilibacillus orientalis]SFL40436.1 membrane protein DedA, SNARE-associated domain [Gracilibacillus orientalis]
MQDWFFTVMNEFGYLGIMFLIALENIFPPIPSEVVLTFGGFFTTVSSLHIVGVILSSTAGSVLGAIVLYLIGMLLNIQRLEKIVEKWGYILRLKKEDIHKADEWFDKYGYWTIFFCRFIPIVRSLISIPAGMSQMNVTLFLLFTTLGTLIWNTVLVLLGAYVGESWEDIVRYLDIYSNFFYLLICLGALFFLIRVLRRRK